MVMPEQVFDRWHNSANDSRLDLWVSAINGFIRNPLFGSGLSSASMLSVSEVGNYSHNVYIDLLTSGGIVGCLFFIYILKKNCFKSNQYNLKFIYASGLAFFIPIFFINGLTTSTFITPLILMSILSNYCKNSTNEYNELFI